MVKYCSKCGSQNDDENKYCQQCGHSWDQKKPAVAVVLNFFILWGLGYWYLGIKKVYGLPWYSLAILLIVLWAFAVNDPTGLLLLIIIVLNFALAYDLYQKGSGKSGWVPINR